MSYNSSVTKIWTWFVISLALASHANGKLPSYIKICHRSNPNLNMCLKNTIEKLAPAMAKGIPELFIPPVEPLFIPEVKLDQSSGAVMVQSSYTNIKIEGLSNYTVTEVNADLKGNNLTIVLKFPQIDLSSDYSIKGKILLLPLNGDGTCEANFTDIDVTTMLLVSRFESENKEYLKLDDIIISYTVKESKVNFNNLFNGDKILGATMNSFLNDNWQLVAEEIRPIMEEIMSKMLRSTAELLFEQFSLDELIPK